MKPTLLILPLYTASGPSSRYRSYNYIEYLQQAFEIRIEPLFSEEYYANRFKSSGRRGVLWISFKSYVNRIRQLSRNQQHDVVFIEKQLFPFLPAWFEIPFLRRMNTIVFDFDDAVWHAYDQGPLLIRAFLGNKFLRILPYGNLVTAGCRYLADYTTPHAHTLRVPTVVHLPQWQEGAMPTSRERSLAQDSQTSISSASDTSRRFRIGWIGSTTTSGYVMRILPFMREASAANPRLVFTFMGFDARLADALVGLPCELIDWSEADEVPWLNSIDLGIMPLADEPFARGKCGLKLIQYMSVGKVWAATALQTNIDLNVTGVNYLVYDERSWVQVFDEAFENWDALPCLGEKNRAYVADELSYEVVGPRLTQSLLEVQASSRAGAGA